MKLVVKPRFSQKKSEVKQIRSVGDIPAVIYSSKKEPVSLIVSGQEFDTVLRQMQPGRLPTTVFTLSDGVKECQAIIKEIQYHVITYKVSHIDFEELMDGVHVHVKVPVNCIGAMECIGVKLGGVVRQVMRHVKVKCQPKHIPTKFDIDVKSANIGSSLRVAALQGVSSDVTVLAKDREVIAVIAKR
ncbi:MAG: 50S ribosomal protein L25/general stress protein Ctc [Chlamydiales bacterium]|jgi:large subunit ribosomal protein L25|nr:50S ribosomal protein L25/general stress protein Ctc [Chlamydiales bacterium]